MTFNKPGADWLLRNFDANRQELRDGHVYTRHIIDVFLDHNDDACDCESIAGGTASRCYWDRRVVLHSQFAMQVIPLLRDAREFSTP